VASDVNPPVWRRRAIIRPIRFSLLADNQSRGTSAMRTAVAAPSRFSFSSLAAVYRAAQSVGEVTRKGFRRALLPL
jgi:hypothetical protein